MILYRNLHDVKISICSRLLASEMTILEFSRPSVLSRTLHTLLRPWPGMKLYESDYSEEFELWMNKELVKLALNHFPQSRLKSDSHSPRSRHESDVTLAYIDPLFVQMLYCRLTT